MSAVVLAAGVTSTFAWFTTQAKATFTAGTLTVNAPSNIKVAAYDLSLDAPETKAIAAGTSIPGHTHSLGSVSSEYGKDFYAPLALAASYDANTQYGTAAAAKTAGNNYTGYMKYNLAVTAAKGEDGKLLKVTVKTTATDATVLSGYRVGIFLVSVNKNAASDSVAADTSDTLTPMMESTTAVYQYVLGETGVNNDTYVSSVDGTSKKATVSNDRVVTAIGSGHSTTFNSSVFATLADKHVCANFVIALWLEGTVDTPQNGAAGATIGLTTDFELVAA